MSYARFDNKPPYYGRETDAFYDEGQGVPQLNKNNITQQDIFRNHFLFTQEHRRDHNAMLKTAEKSISMENELAKLFFSDRNMKRIQKQIKKEIYNRTDHKFRLDVDQDENDLLIAMRAIFLQEARHLPGEMIRQTKRLNKHVVNYIVPDMITEIKQYYGYMKDVNEPLKPINRPVNVNNKGRLTMPSITTTWGLR